MQDVAAQDTYQYMYAMTTAGARPSPAVQCTYTLVACQQRCFVKGSVAKGKRQGTMRHLNNASQPNERSVLHQAAG